MYFIRRPKELDVWGNLVIQRQALLEQGLPVQGLNAPDSLQILCNEQEFLNRMEELEEQGKQDTNQTLVPVVKKRKLHDGRADAENVAPKTPKSGSAKRAAPSVKQKAAQANSFMDFFELPSNSYVQKSALAVVIKNLRGDLRSRISNEKKPRNMTGSDATAQIAEGQLRKAALEVRKYLVNYSNHPDSSVDAMMHLIISQGPESIHQIRQWLDIPALNAVSDETITNIYEDFKNSTKHFAKSVERETRYNLIKSQHRLRCTKVQITKESALKGCYSGPFGFVHAQLSRQGEELRADEVKNKPSLCTDLRNQNGINILAMLSHEDGSFKAMPGPTDAFPEGFIFLGCEICQGKSEGNECNCTDWLAKVGVPDTERSSFEFDLDEMIVPGHMHLFCFGAKRWEGTQGILNLRRFTADDNGEGGVQIVGLTRESKDSK